MDQKQSEREPRARSLDEAREFLDERDGHTRVFEVEWTWKVTWYIAAASKEEALKAAQEVSDQELRDCQDDPELYVSNDLAEQAKKHAEKFKCEVKPPRADSGVFEGEIIAVNEYIAQRVWHLIVETMGEHMMCPSCGYEDWTNEFNLNPEPLKYGYIPIMGCPECRQPLDWLELLRKEEPDYRTGSLFGEEGEGDGVQGREEDG